MNPTCQTLKQLAATSETCSMSDQCTGLYCLVSGVGSIEFQVEPCHNPPAIRVIGRDGSGTILVNETLTKSRQQDLPGGIGTLSIDIGQTSNEDSLSLSVSHVYNESMQHTNIEFNRLLQLWQALPYLLSL